MILYDKLYKAIGVRKITHFFNPVILDAKELEFPKNSLIHNYLSSDINTEISTNISYFNKVDVKVYVNTVLDYKIKEPLGIVRKNTSINSTTLIGDLGKLEKKWKFLKPNITNLKMVEKDLYIFNYGSLNFVHKYGMNPLNGYYKFVNSFTTAIVNSKSTTETSRNLFMILQLPPELPKRDVLDKYAKKITTQALNELTDYKYLMLIEFWKYFTKELKAESILSMLTPQEMSKLNILFVLDNKISLINFKLLASLVKDYNIDGPLQKLGDDQARKLFYIYINSIINAKPLSLSAITENSNEKELRIKLPGIAPVSNATGQSENDTIDLDDYLETINVKIPVSNTSEHEDDIADDAVDIDEVESNTRSSGSELKALLEEANTTETETLQELLTSSPDQVSKLETEINVLKTAGFISTNEHGRLLDAVKTQGEKPSPYNDGLKLKDLLDDTKDNYTVTQESASITSTPSVIDASYNKNTLNTITKSYIKGQMKKDITRMFYSIQNNGIVIDNHEVVSSESILGKTEQHTLNITTLNGKKSTIRISLPVIEEDGTFKLSGNTYKMRPQRSDLPIRKIDSNIVALSSYYGKLFLSKSTYKKDDSGYFLRRRIIEKYDNDPKLKDLVLLPVDNKDTELPDTFNLFARYIKSFKYDGVYYSFNYSERKKLLGNVSDDVLADIEENGVLIGMNKTVPIVMSVNNTMYSYENGKYTEFGDLLEIVGIDMLDSPVEYVNIRLFRDQFPVALLLGYYIGLEKLLKLLKTKYTRIEDGKNQRLEKDEYKLKFKDVTLIVKRDLGQNDMIVYGLTSLNQYLQKVNFDSLNKKSSFATLFTYMNLSLMHINEIKLLEDMYIDPKTKTVLRELKLPELFKGLLFKAVELLLDDNYKNPNNITEMSVKGYERISGLLYSELIKSIKEHNNRSFFSKSKITVYPFSVINKINEDSTTVLVDDLNPIAYVKQGEDITYLGAFGRNKESMNRDTRAMHASEIGIISESSKDSGDVGISAYMTANPNVSSTLGLVSEYDVNASSSWSNMLSTSAMLAPFAITEDVKRLGFVNIQNSHVIPIKNMRVPYVRTGYEAILAIKADGKYTRIAKDEGIVKKATKKEIVVEYKNGGIEKIALKTWTTKEESGSCYTHTLIANLKQGETFRKDDTIAYTDSFFEPDVFDKNRVVYKAGTFIKVCLMEDIQTYEDSGAISKELSSVLSTDITKVKSVVVSNTDNVLNLVKVGDTVKTSDVLFTTVSGTIGSTSGLDAKALEILQNLKSSSPKAKVNGKVTKVVIYYNCEKEALSPSLKEAVEISDEYLLETVGYTGKVSSSYSIQGIPLLENQLEIKVYLMVNDNMGIGDKAIIGNQLKFTIGEVYDYDISMLDGTKVDMIFSNKSIAARIVNSPMLIGTTSTVLDLLTDKVLETYFK